MWMGIGTMLGFVIIDRYIQVSDEDCIAASRRLAKEEGLFCGFSSGANAAAGTFVRKLFTFSALKLLARPEFKGKTIVICLCDSGKTHNLSVEYCRIEVSLH